MRILQITSLFPQGSIGGICESIDEQFCNENMGESRIIYFWGSTSKNNNAVKCGNYFYQKMVALISRITGRYGYISKHSTRKAIKEINKFNPDIIHIHNIHDHCIDLELFFRYLKSNRAKVIWTLHDCWAYTGYCCYYSLCDCKKWKYNCNQCPEKKQFSWFFDKSQWLFEKKKELFQNTVFDIVTPSDWLAGEVRESFLSKHKICVIKNGIDLDRFYPRESTTVREKYSIEEKEYIILGVAFQWTVRKGYDFFLELATQLPHNYRIMLVGSQEKIGHIQNKQIIWIDRTDSQDELADMYSEADVFFNPTREEVLGLVNIESLACGTPVITFDSGGSPECIDSTCGYVIKNESIDESIKAIKKVCEDKVFSVEACVERAKKFSEKRTYEEYIMKYREIMSR